MKVYHSVYDWQKALDPRAVMALHKLGVSAYRIIGQPGKLKGCKLCFTYTGDSEQAKHIVASFLQDEFDATNIKFCVNQNDSSQVYATFDHGKDGSNGAQNV